jgi:hypothetical protein
VGSFSEALRMQAVSWLVNWGLEAVGPGGDVASAVAYLFRPIGSLISVPRRYYFWIMIGYVAERRSLI